MRQVNTLSHTDAMTILHTIQARLEQDGLSAAVAIVDEHGELIAFLRTDNCMLASIQIAINKAFTAARERRETGVIGEDARQRGYPITNYGDLRYVGWDGGVPIRVQGEVVGGVGISGLYEAIEIDLAKLGIAAL